MTISDRRPKVKARPEVEALTAYRLRQHAEVKLNQNESPLDWPAEFKDDVARRVAARPWNRYPSVDAAVLREAYARYCGVDAQMVAATNGSNEAILSVVQTFATGQSVVLTVPGYSMVRPLVAVAGAQVTAVPLRSDFGLDLDAMLPAVGRPDAAVVVIASPNNPTGNAFARAEIEAVLDAARGLVAIDEAYAGFAGDSFVPDLAGRSNLAVLRTCSKAFALAGVRVGWIVAGEAVIGSIRKALPPYNLNTFAQETALAALERPDLIAARVKLIVGERARVAAALGRVDGVTAFPSEANFILFRTPHPAEAVFAGLLRRGVLVRDVSGVPLLERCLRVTIGAPGENDRFLGALQAILLEQQTPPT